MKGIISTMATLFCFFCPMMAQAEVATPAAISLPLSDWQEFHSLTGKCSMNFPGRPEHVSENIGYPGEKESLKYDAYIADLEKKSVFLLLVAQYPSFVDESLAHVGLEEFLNGILMSSPGTQLLFADLALVEGKEALDFFVRTGGVYFKGRALVSGKNLYLMAMECEVQHYDETHYNKFVNSFKFSK